MKVGIIGSGLGGLLTGTSLIKKGYDVRIFEKLPHAGGRFTDITYKGFELSTGALHMIPHGEKGPLGKMLRSLDLNVEIIPSTPSGTFKINGKDYLFDDLFSLFSIRDKMTLTKLMAGLKFGSGDEKTFREWIKKRMNNKLIFNIADSFCGWSLSVDSTDISSREIIAITKNIYRLGGPGIPMGGCKGVTNALVSEFEKHGGKIQYETPVKEILVEDKKVKGISTKEESYNLDLIVSDIGPKQTIALCGESSFDASYVKSMKNIKETSGIKISIACDKAMIGHSGVLFTPQAKRIDGANEVTNADPSLAPKGKHLLMTHQVLKSEDVKKEIELGIEDLHAIFPNFDEHCKILMIQTYRDGWPVNRVPSGKHLSSTTPIKGLYLVGDAIKPEGWMESEGIAEGVKMALNNIEKNL